jgi:DNA end-binding protein Ku
MAVAHKSAIIFDFVYIPILLYTAVKDNDIHFTQLHKTTKERIQYKKTCPHCGSEVKPEDIVKGYQYGTDRYVVITEDDIERIKTEKDKSIQILQTTDLSSINPIYFNKTYNVVPDVGSERAFGLLRLALLEEGKVAIAKTVLGANETMMAIMPTSTGMVINTLYYVDEVKELPMSYAKADVHPEELMIAKTLIRSMDKPYEPELYHDEYQLRLKELIDAKIDGEDVFITDENAPRVINLMEALERSVANRKQE